ncbi:hypothetical protein QBC47DRAFT_67551 [Echria macrotheca]|uniref:Uncharacterized protein n=1 Tax=Echria macrotheca TaxID=438768 RepID=A0AAJ0B5N6_9PEZI|nr:hypothetical protein QBC47DRAFT_67551 [Echria macrotheca]
MTAMTSRASQSPTRPSYEIPEENVRRPTLTVEDGMTMTERKHTNPGPEGFSNVSHPLSSRHHRHQHQERKREGDNPSVHLAVEQQTSCKMASRSRLATGPVLASSRIPPPTMFHQISHEHAPVHSMPCLGIWKARASAGNKDGPCCKSWPSPTSEMRVLHSAFVPAFLRCHRHTACPERGETPREKGRTRTRRDGKEGCNNAEAAEITRPVGSDKRKRNQRDVVICPEDIRWRVAGWVCNAMESRGPDASGRRQHCGGTHIWMAPRHNITALRVALTLRVTG